jgi:hypothetical protein
MLTRDHLDRAVAGGVISPAQRDALLAMAGGHAASGLQAAARIADASANSNADDVRDDMRLVGGGNDVFVTIGVLLLTFGAGFALTPLVGPDSAWLSVIIGAGLWAIAEIVTRQKRMRLSSTVLAAMLR